MYALFAFAIDLCCVYVADSIKITNNHFTMFESFFCRAFCYRMPYTGLYTHMHSICILRTSQSKEEEQKDRPIILFENDGLSKNTLHEYGNKAVTLREYKGVTLHILEITHCHIYILQDNVLLQWM